MSNIKNYEGLIQLNTLIDRANNNLLKAQKEELAKEEIDISSGLKIASYGNVIYLTTILKKYLLICNVIPMIKLEKNKTQFSFGDHKNTNENSSKFITIQYESNIHITFAT